MKKSSTQPSMNWTDRVNHKALLGLKDDLGGEGLTDSFKPGVSFIGYSIIIIIKLGS